MSGWLLKSSGQEVLLVGKAGQTVTRGNENKSSCNQLSNTIGANRFTTGIKYLPFVMSG